MLPVTKIRKPTFPRENVRVSPLTVSNLSFWGIWYKHDAVGVWLWAALCKVPGGRVSRLGKALTFPQFSRQQTPAVPANWGPVEPPPRFSLSPPPRRAPALTVPGVLPPTAVAANVFDLLAQLTMDHKGHVVVVGGGFLQGLHPQQIKSFLFGSLGARAWHRAFPAARRAERKPPRLRSARRLRHPAPGRPRPGAAPAPERCYSRPVAWPACPRPAPHSRLYSNATKTGRVRARRGRVLTSPTSLPKLAHIPWLKEGLLKAFRGPT